MAHLVTGYAGYEHIQSEDDGAYNAAFFGSGQYVMESGNQFEGSILDNNTVRILDGDGMMYGRHFRIKPNTYEDLTITTGTAGMNRVDLICMTYEKDSTSQTEKVYLQVIKGTESEGTAEIPAYTDGNILEGATKNQMPLYKVTIEGVVLMDIEPLFVTIPTYKTLAEQYALQFQQACETYLGALNILDSKEEIEANTLANQLAGALGVKEGLASKQGTITGGATTIASSNLTKNRALISDGNGKVAVSAVTATQLGYLKNAVGDIQAQLNARQLVITFQNTEDSYIQTDSAYGSTWLANTFRIMTSIGELTNAYKFQQAHKGACIPIEIMAYQTSDPSFVFPISLNQVGGAIRGICPLNTQMTIQILWAYWA